MLTDRKKDEDVGEVSPYEGIQKNVVLHEARVFNQAPINPRQCVTVLTKILYLLIKGETFSNEENTDIFFSVTKLFQSQDPMLRRMVYLTIKSLNTKQDEVLVVVSSLCQDINSKNDVFRSNAIRVLGKVVDGQMLAQVERFFKQAIVDKNPFTASSSLVAGIHLFSVGPDTIKRWVNEVQEATNNKSKMVQYHALHLLYLIKKHDRLAISKVVSALARNPPKSPLAQCLLIRFICTVLDDPANSPDKTLIDFLTSCLRNKNSMVIYEAARELSRLKHVTVQQVAPAVTALQDFLNHPIPTQRFAAVRTLAEVVQNFPLLVTPCSVDLEHLINDSNRSIATLAITTLLKTGVEASVDRLMKSISGFMSEISDEFKIVVVDAIRSLCLKFPQKYQSLLKFLSGILREEGGFEYKKAIVNTMLVLMNEIEEAKDLGLEHLCEFIEDCEFPDLSVQILHVLADESARIRNPARFIRHVFNRVILEIETVRAGAVSSLAKIGVSVDSLSESVQVLLRRCLNENDDEVRDRAVLYLELLTQQSAQSKKLLLEPFPFSVQDLDTSLSTYLENGNFDTPFSLDHIEVKEQNPLRPVPVDNSAPVAPVVGGKGRSEAEQNPFLALLNSIPEFAALGPLFRSSKVTDLTESEAEYVVTCVKHIFADHVVFQFNVTNTLEDAILDNVTVELDLAESDWTEESVVPAPSLPGNASGITFVCVARPPDSFSLASAPAVLKFTMKQDADDEGYVDEYQLEDIEVSESEFIKKNRDMNLLEFRRQWESLGDRCEAVKKYSLNMQDLQEAVDAVMELVGMSPVENSQKVPEGAQSHAVNLVGEFIGGTPVFARAGFMIDPKHGVTLKIASRCSEPRIGEMITNCIH